MAEAKHEMLSELNKLLECSICLRTFSKPLCLPCMHTFCCDCIKEYVENLQKDGSEGSEFNCPTCRCRIDIPEGGVEKLPRHLFVNNLKEVIASTTKPETKCDYCVKTGKETSASWRCIDCCHSLCGTCKQAHDLVHSVSNELHTLMQFDEWKNSDFSAICNQSKELCPNHKNKPLEFYCCRCEVTICQTCHTLGHNDHECRDVAEVADETKPVIQDSMENIAKLIQRKEDAIKELTQCKDTLASSHNDVIQFIRQQKSSFLTSISKYFDDIEKKADEISTESRKIIILNLESLKSDISSLENSNQIGKAVHNYGRKAEIVESSKRLLEIIKSQEECDLNMDQIKRSLHILKFKVNNLEIREDLFGVSEKRRLFPDLQTATGDDARLCGPMMQSVAPSMGKIRIFPQFMGWINTEQRRVRSVTVTSRVKADYNIIAVVGDDVSVYNQDGRKLHNFSRPPGIKEWEPYNVNAYDGGEQPVVIVTNSCSRADGGGVYVYTADGCFTRKTIKVDYPQKAAARDDRLVAVLECNVYEDIGWVNVYDIETGVVVTSTCHSSWEGVGSEFLSVSPATGEILVSCCYDGVTAFSPVDLTPRWCYSRRDCSAGQLCHPAGVCVDQAGRVLVCDPDTGRVVVLSQDGEFLTSISTHSLIARGPYDLTLTRHGQLVMCGRYGDGQGVIFITEYLENMTI